MARYTWKNAHDWLQDKLDACNVSDLRAIARELMMQLDDDTIQDLFETEMDQAGYFNDLDDPSDEA